MGVVFAGLACPLGAVACDEKCNDAGCGTYVTLTKRLPADFEASGTYSVRFCRNADCLSGTLALTPTAVADGGVFVSFPDPETTNSGRGLRVNATLWASVGRRYRLEAHYYPETLADAVDGDRFSLTILETNGTTVAALSGAVTYSTITASRDSCGPPVCRSATLEDVVDPGDAGPPVPVDASLFRDAQ